MIQPGKDWFRLQRGGFAKRLHDPVRCRLRRDRDVLDHAPVVPDDLYVVHKVKYMLELKGRSQPVKTAQVGSTGNRSKSLTGQVLAGNNPGAIAVKS